MVANGRKVAEGDAAILHDATFVLPEATVTHALRPTFHRQRTSSTLVDVPGVVQIERLSLDQCLWPLNAAFIDPATDAVRFVAVGLSGIQHCRRRPKAVALPRQGAGNGPVEYPRELTAKFRKQVAVLLFRGNGHAQRGKANAAPDAMVVAGDARLVIARDPDFERRLKLEIFTVEEPRGDGLATRD